MNLDDATVTVTTDEQVNGALAESNQIRALDIFETYGFVRINNVFTDEQISTWKEHYYQRYASYLDGTRKDDKRPLFTVDTEGKLNTPELYANKLLFPLIKNWLGNDCILGAMSSVVSFPGAPDQHIHRDTLSIFGDDFTVDKDIPPYALTVLMPLIDFTLETGCTKIWPKSHKWANNEEALNSIEPIDPEVQVGSVLITNSKVLHCGGANVSQLIRPLIYLTYHRNWFRDFWGYELRAPVTISNKEYQRVPEENRVLFEWTKDRYSKIRLKWAVKRAIPYSLRKAVRKLRGAAS